MKPFLAKITCPARGPYEDDATNEQKDQLWRNGVVDKALLATLGTYQAKTYIEGIEAAYKTQAAKLVAGRRRAYAIVWLALALLLFFFGSEEAIGAGAMLLLLSLGCYLASFAK